MRKLRHFTPDEDAPLLISWHRGDLAAFETLIWKYQKRIFNLALLLTGIQRTACEVTENSFLTAYQKIRSQKSNVRFSSWLVTIALNECREHNDYQTEESDTPADPDMPLTDEFTYSAAMNKKLELCIRELPVELGELILLRYVRGYSLERMEEILKISGELLLARLFEAQCTLAIWLRSTTENPAEFSIMKTGEIAIHPEIQRNFSAYLDNSLESDDKDLIKTHLKNCGSCRKALAELEWMIEDIKSLPDAEPPQWLAASIMQKVKSAPGTAVNIQTPSHLRFMITVAVLLVSLIGISSLLHFNSSKSALDLREIVNPPQSQPSAELKQPQIAAHITSLFKVFKGSAPKPDTLLEPEITPKTAAQIPQIFPSEPPQSVTPSKSAPVAAPIRIDPLQKNDKAGGILPPALPEWGDPPAQSLAQQKKAASPLSRSDEIAVVLNTADPAVAGHNIESAVTALGGNVSGRAYHGGTSILYTKIEVDRFFDLMSRLEKIGAIQELPQLPEGAEGTLELTIRW